MFRNMRRSGQALPPETVKEILKTVNTGVLSVSGDDGYPYGVPVDFVYTDGKILFHCALTGHKLDGIRRNNKVSFCVISADDVYPDEYTTYYRSVILFGRASVLEFRKEKITAMKKSWKNILHGIRQKLSRKKSITVSRVLRSLK